MTPAMLIRRTRADGVLLALTPAGTLKVTGSEAAVRQWTPTLRSHRQALLDALQAALAQFQFGLVEQDIADGAPADELRRVNALCWHLVQADGLAIDDAMRVAADTVVSCPPAECEKAYDDPYETWRRVTRQADHPEGIGSSTSPDTGGFGPRSRACGSSLATVGTSHRKEMV